MSRKIVRLPLPVPGQAAGAGPGRMGVAPAPWTPRRDLFQTASALVIHVELAGLRREDLDLRVAGDQLCIRGVRRERALPPGGQVVRREIPYGAFETRVAIPAGYDAARARASYQNGFLRVEVPRVASAPSVLPVGPPSRKIS
jgi:HSP20 family protein